MQAQRETSWQWTPRAAITAADACRVCSALALEYTDCALVRVRLHEPHGRDGKDADEYPERNDDNDDSTPSAGNRGRRRDLELAGHSERISSLCVFRESTRSSITLCSASSDCVIVWHVTDDCTCVSKIVLYGQQQQTEPSAVAFDHTGTLVALCCDRIVQVFVIERREVLVTLEGHLARVTKCEFHPIRRHVLITCSEDRTFKIWDLAAKTLLFQSAVLSAFAILSLATNPVTGDFAVGFADGTVRVFALLESSFAKEMATVQIESYLRKAVWRKQDEIQDLLLESPNVVSSLPPWARSDESYATAQIQAQIQALSLQPPSRVGMATVLTCTALASTSSEFKPDVAFPALALSYFCVRSASSSSSLGEDIGRRAQFNSHGEQDLLGWEQFLVVGTPRHVVVVNAFSLELSVLQDLQVPIRIATRGDSSHGSSSRHCKPTDAVVATAKDFCFFQDVNSSEAVACGVVSAFQPHFTLFWAACRTSGSTRSHDDSNDNNSGDGTPTNQSTSAHDSSSSSNNNSLRISVLPTAPPPADSVLNLPSLAVVAGAKLPKKAVKGSLDKPVTFHTRIKSSGYGAAVPFSAKRTRVQNRKAMPPPSSTNKTDAFLKEYPSECGVLQHFQQKHALPRDALHQGAIHHIEFSSDAKWIATCGSDKVAQVCKLPFSRFQGDSNVFAGHDGAVKSIRWSHSNEMVVTTSADKSARVWLADSDVASLVLHGLRPVSTPSSSPPTSRLRSSPVAAPTLSFSSSSSSSAKKPTTMVTSAAKHELVDAQFFYMDKFILSGCGNAVRLHQFELDELHARAQKKQATRNDIKVADNKSRKRKVAEWRCDGMQSLTALACVNGSFLSSVVLAAGSDRSLRVFDAAVGRSVRVITAAHARATHSLALPRASCFTSHPSNFYDLLLSSAANSTTHLWDIRADNCVMRFGEHVNRVHALGVAFSPCMRYVASGSEDRMAYIYDIRTGRCVKKLAGHTDVVTAVAFNPLYPQLATASYDGTVRFYCDRDGE